MNTRLVLSVVFASSMSMGAATVALADGGVPAVKAASVAEMLQKKQESQKREQLVKAGRWDDVRKLEEAQAMRERERQQKVIAQMNDDLARSAKSDAPAATELLDACDKETLRMRQMKSAHVE